MKEGNTSTSALFRGLVIISFDFCDDSNLERSFSWFEGKINF
jgi:hypothetical protein